MTKLICTFRCSCESA